MNGSGRSEYLAAAIMWATDNKIDVLSMSQWDPDGADDPHEVPWDDVSRAADAFVEAGGSRGHKARLSMVERFVLWAR